MKLATNKAIHALPTCPGCGKPAPLAFIKSSNGRQWVNCACAPCGFAMDHEDNWVFYVGGVTSKTAKQSAAV